jgi:hypothetical protein
MNFLKRLLEGYNTDNEALNSSLKTEKNLQLESLLDKSILEDLNKQCIYPTTYHEENDVFIASYPKSGVTWLRHLTASLVYGMDSSKVSDILVNTVFPDLHAYKYYLRTGFPVVFKTHDLPRPEMKRVIHLVRDGRDVMVSYYAMLKNQGYEITLDKMIKGEVELFPCDWSSHCSEWLRNPYKSNICRISYEDLKLSPVKTLQKYCCFVGIDADEAKITAAISQSEFIKMQIKEKDQGWGHNNLRTGLFVRKGQIGSYRNEMSEELIKEFNELNHDMLSSLGYSLLE